LDKKGMSHHSLRTCRLFLKSRNFLATEAVGSSLVLKMDGSSDSSVEVLRRKILDIRDVTVEPLTKSAFLKPLHMSFTQNKRKRFWDFIRVHDSVAVLIFNVDKQVLIVVKQFRPPVYFTSAFEDPKAAANPEAVDWTKVPASKGVTVELCAGILDKERLTAQETAREEVLEECGYDVPLGKFEFVRKLRSGVGSSGSTTSLFYVEVNDKEKVSQGGGNPEEGELIEVAEMTIPEMTSYINSESLQSPGDFAYAIMWFLTSRYQKN